MKKTRYAWALVARLGVVAMLNYLDRQMIFSLLPPLQAVIACAAGNLVNFNDDFPFALIPAKLKIFCRCPKLNRKCRRVEFFASQQL